jgi:hypothetical protein
MKMVVINKDNEMMSCEEHAYKRHKDQCASYDMVAPSCNRIMAIGLLLLRVDSMVKSFIL